MIQSIMLAAMGFLAASLLALLVAPSFWSRAVRLTNQRLRNALPISEQEIRADKDLLRAEYALKVHQLERELDQSRLAAHRQQIEINRRDIDIRRLADDLGHTEAGLNEHRNAHMVLGQTVSQRIPLLEQSLEEARGLLQARDVAINELQTTADRQAGALEDGRAILTQRALEVQRLQALFQEASAQGRERRSDGGGDSGLALRAEIESLKARLAERAAVIERLQNDAAARPRTTAAIAEIAGLQDDMDPAQLRGRVAEQTAEIRQLRRDLESARQTPGSTILPPHDAALAVDHVRRLEVLLREQTDEIARLRVENEAASQAGDPAANALVRESKTWLKARMERVESDFEREREATGRLRAELAAANERLARQASQFRDELQRVSARQGKPAREALRSLTAARSPSAPSAAASAEAHAENATLPTHRPAISARGRELQLALQGHFGEAADGEVTGAAPSLTETPAQPEIAGTAQIEAQASNSPSADEPAKETMRGRLLQRLKIYERA